MKHRKMATSSARLVLVAALVAGLVAALAACGGQTGSNKAGSTGAAKNGKVPVIGILQFVQHDALDAGRDGFIKALAENGYKDGETVKFLVQNAQADTNNCSTIADQFVGAKVDLVLAIATPATQAMAAKTTTIPILGTAVTDYVVAKLAASNEAPGGNVSGTTDMNPIKEQLALLKELVPAAKTVGLLYTSSEDNSVLQVKLAKKELDSLGLKYTEITVNNSNEVQQATEALVTKCNVIYIPTDNTVASAMPIVSSVATKAKIPVICGEAGMVKKGGLATIGINYFDLGYATGLMAVKILKGEAKPATMAIQGGSKFDFYINGATAKEIGMTIPAKYKDAVK